MTEQRCTIGLVIPAYNEANRIEKTVREVVSYLRAQSYAWKVLVVDDGSVDPTPAIVRSLMESIPELDLLANDHRGKAYAVRSGVLATKADYVIFSDADLSVPITELERVLARLRAGASVVIGSRETKGAQRIGEPSYRHVMGRVFSLFYRLLILPGVQDAQCGFKGFRIDVARALFRSLLLYGDKAPVVKGGMVTGFDVELLFLARRWGFVVEEVPVDWYYGSGSKVRPTRDVPKMVFDVCRIRWFAFTGRYARSYQER